MAWGYEAHFTVEHDNTLKRKIDCKDCVYYDRSDKSCMKTPRYLPEDGYNSWRQCGYFELDSSTSHYDEKLQQFKEWSNKMARKEAANHKKVFLNQSKNRIEHPAVSKASIEKAKQKTVNAENRISDKECKVLVLKEYETHKEIPKGAAYKLLDIYLDDGKKKSIQLAVYNGCAYLKKNAYPDEYIGEVKRIFRKH